MSEEISQYESYRIEEFRKKQKQKPKKRKVSKLKIPRGNLEYLLRPFRFNLIFQVDHMRFKISNQMTTGLNQRERTELKTLILSTPSDKLDTPFKRKRFYKQILKGISNATFIREDWQFGDMDCNGERDLKILDFKFPSLIKISFKEYIEWLNEDRKRHGKTPIILVSKGDPWTRELSCYARSFRKKDP